MMMKILMLSQIVFLLQFCCLMTLHYKFLMVLMNLELLGIQVIFIMMVLMFTSYLDFITFLLVLTMAACELAVGLSILLRISRNSSSDSMLSFNSTKC